MAFNVNAPEIDMSDIRKSLKQIRSWIHQLNENLRYTLTHIEEENFTSELKLTLDGKLDQTSLESLTAAIEQNRADIETRVSESDLHRAIRMIHVGGVNLISHDARNWQSGAWNENAEITASNDAIALNNYIPVEAGESLSVNSFCSNDMILSFYDAQDARVSNPTALSALTLPATIEAPAHTARLRVHCVKNGGASVYDMGGEFKFKLERGNKSTDWSRATDDAARSLITLTGGSVQKASLRNAESSNNYRDVTINFADMRFTAPPTLIVTPDYAGALATPYGVFAYIRAISSQSAQVRMISNMTSMDIQAGLNWLALGQTA